MSDYVKELRQLVGSRPVIFIGSCVLLLDGQNRILLNRRLDNGLWGLPGGMMEPGETLEETARREMYEETGVTLGSLRLLDIFSGPELFYTYPNGDQVHNVTAAYIADRYEGTLQADRTETTEVRFFALDELPDERELSPSIRPILRRFLEKR